MIIDGAIDVLLFPNITDDLEHRYESHQDNASKRLLLTLTVSGFCADYASNVSLYCPRHPAPVTSSMNRQTLLYVTPISDYPITHRCRMIFRPGLSADDGGDVMSEPEQDRATRAKEDIIIAQKQRYNDVNLHASATGPPPPLEAVNASATLNALGSPFNGGTGYKIDPEMLAKHIGTFEIILEHSKEQREKLQRAAAAATPPSHDLPAAAQALAARSSLVTAACENDDIAVYAEGLIDALKKAKSTYSEHEDTTSQKFNTARGDSNLLFRK